MCPFASNSITKHEYIGRRTVQPSNRVYRPPPLGYLSLGVCPLDRRGVPPPLGGVDNSLGRSLFTHSRSAQCSAPTLQENNTRSKRESLRDTRRRRRRSNRYATLVTLVAAISQRGRKSNSCCCSLLEHQQ